MPDGVGDGQARLLAGERLAHDAGEEAGGRLVGRAGAHSNRRQPQAYPVQKAAARIIGESSSRIAFWVP